MPVITNQTHLADRVGLPGQSSETEAMRGSELSSDGTISMTRAQAAEQEVVRDGIGSLGPIYIRDLLLEAARLAPPLLRGWSITPLDDRLLIEYASFREGYVCEACKGMGTSTDTCVACDGKGKCEPKPGWKLEDCQDCKIVGADRTEPYSSGHLPCAACLGSGLAPGVLAMPDQSKQDHSYGDILSTGSSVYDLRPGDRVMFSKMAGIYIRADEHNCCLLRRGEVMGFMHKEAKG